MNDEKMIKLQHFFSNDIRIKKEIYDMAPQVLNGYVDEESVSKYTDKLNDSLIYIFSELKCITIDMFGKESNVFNRLCYLEQTIKSSFYSCGLDINKLKLFYQKFISNMEPNFIDSVKSTCKGYAFNEISAVNEASSINEYLYFMHSYIVNNDTILKSLPLICEKKNDQEYSISLRGNRNPIFEQLFVMFPSSLDCGITDMVIIDDRKLIIMVRDRGHALSMEVSLNNDIARIEYFIPKLCNIEMINRLPGVNKVNKDSVGATGVMEVKISDLPKTLFSFISMVPTDLDMFNSYGR